MDEWIRWGIGGVLFGAIAVFSWITNRLFQRQDKLEETKANKDSTDKRFDEMFLRLDRHIQEDRDMHSRVGAKLDRTNEHLSVTNTTLAALAGRFEERSRSGSNHQ